MRIILSCLVCGKTIQMNPYAVARGRGRYCSNQCKYLAQTEDPIPRILSCLVCGKTIKVRPHEFARGRGRFCSKPCQYLDQSRGAMPVEDRFWSHVDRTGGPDTCWLWMGILTYKGYGRFHEDARLLSGKTTPAHRFAYRTAHGVIPAGMSVCHTCDNRRCCNPAHLWLGTNADNTRDMVAKGRHRWTPGEQSVNALLTESDVRAIRSAYGDGKTSLSLLGKRFGVTPQCIALVVKRKSWKHVT